MDPTPRARGDVWVFLTLLLLLSGCFYLLIVVVAGMAAEWTAYALGFMWCPGLAALATKLVRDRTLKGLGWGWGRKVNLLVAYGLAIATCLPPYLVIWLGLGAFNRGGLDAGREALGLSPGPLGHLGLLAAVLVLSPMLGLVSAAGEEIGWRGFLVPRMHAFMGFSRTSLLVGLVWAVWHYPINMAVFPLYRPDVPLWYANACFTILVVGASFAHTWLRLRSRSFWPSVVYHAAGNSFLGSLQLLTIETDLTSYLTHEYGASLAVMGLLLGFFFWRRRNEVEPTDARSDGAAERDLGSRTP